MLAEVDNEDARLLLTDAILEEGLTGGSPVSAYREVNSSRYAFTYLADRLLAEDSIEPLRALIEAHQEVQPDDIRLHVYSGQAHLLKNDFSAAAKGGHMASVY